MSMKNSDIIGNRSRDLPVYKYENKHRHIKLGSKMPRQGKGKSKVYPRTGYEGPEGE
jgi:hypothetical protein